MERDHDGGKHAVRSTIIDLDCNPATQEAGMTVSRASPRKIAKKGVAPKSASRRSKIGVVVSAAQRRRLIEDAAYFRAERYRCVEPGNFREEDRCRAETEIKTVIRRNKKS